MHEVRVLLHFGVPAARVFAAVGDHETFLSDRRTTTRIVRPGAAERNGLGCMREVRVRRGPRFLEEITHWEPSVRFDYVIREASVPVRHEVGRLVFTPHGGGTDVVWTSRFSSPVPVVGRLVEKAVGRVFEGVFTGYLAAARAKLEGD